MQTFLSGARGLARNPLGIIALFIALIYGFATLLLGVAADKLDSHERSPLVWFVVAFPVLVLFVFYRLVTRHHGKLYSPADYTKDESFLKTLTEEQRSERLDEEISSIAPEVPATAVPAPQGAARADTARPSVQVDYQELRKKYMAAERLALAKLESERKLRFLKDVTFGEGRAAAFDGVAHSDGVFTAVEIKFIRHDVMSPSIVRETLYRGVTAANLLRSRNETSNFKLVFVIVMEHDNLNHSRLESQLLRLTSDAPYPVELKFYSLATLERDQGTNESGT